MKHLILIIIFIHFSPLLNSAEKIDKTENVTFLNRQVSLAEQYYDRLEINTNMPKNLNSFLDRKALVRTEVPASLWLNIKDSINYESFKTEIVDTIPNFYTNSELQEILNAHSDRPKVPITKIAFRQFLATKSQNFIDNEFLNMVNSMLISNGYVPISF